MAKVLVGGSGDQSNWEHLAPFARVRVRVPAPYVAGDVVVAFRGVDQFIPNLPKFVPQLREAIPKT